MAYTLSAFDLHFLINELEMLVNAKVEKIYQPEKHEFVFIMHVPGRGKHILRVLPNCIFVSDFKGDVPENPSPFCMVLRKYVGNSRLRSIRQLGFERIVEIIFETKDSKFKVFIELFSNGNIILCNESDNIISALITKKWKDRTIRGNILYEYPKKDNNFLEIAYPEFKKIIETSDKESIVKLLAIELGLGGRFAEELCLRANIDRSEKQQNLDVTKIKKLFSEVEKIRSEAINAAKVIDNQKKVIDIVPINMEKYTNFDLVKYPTFSSVLGEILSENIQIEQKKKSDEKHIKEKERLQKILDEQNLTIEKLEKSSVENQRKGELIFEQYTLVNEILLELTKARKKHSWKEIKDKLKDHKVINEIHEKNNEIIIDI